MVVTFSFHSPLDGRVKVIKMKKKRANKVVGGRRGSIVGIAIPPGRGRARPGRESLALNRMDIK